MLRASSGLHEGSAARKRKWWLPRSEFSQRGGIHALSLQGWPVQAGPHFSLFWEEPSCSALTENPGHSAGKTRGLGMAMPVVATLHPPYGTRVPGPEVSLGASGFLLQQQAPLPTRTTSLGCSPEPHIHTGPVNPVKAVNLGLKVLSWHPCRRVAL